MVEGSQRSSQHRPWHGEVVGGPGALKFPKLYGHVRNPCATQCYLDSVTWTTIGLYRCRKPGTRKSSTRSKAAAMAAQAQSQHRASWMSRKKGLPGNWLLHCDSRQTLWDGSNSELFPRLFLKINHLEGYDLKINHLEGYDPWFEPSTITKSSVSWCKAGGGWRTVGQDCRAEGHI